MVKVFETFTQLDSSTTRRFGGTGVGLAISKGLVELMHGTIWCESAPGKGATFYFTFEVNDHKVVNTWDSKTPLASRPLLYTSTIDEFVNSNGMIISDSDESGSSSVSAMEEYQDSSSDDEFADANTIKPRILIVDDTEMNQKVIKRLLSSMGYEDVDVASNGAQAVLAVTNTPYNVIFMDMEMPIMDGVTASNQIRLLTLARQPHIIAITANAFQEDVQRCLEAGMCNHMAKPIKREQLKREMDGAKQVLFGIGKCRCHHHNRHHHSHHPHQQNNHQHPHPHHQQS